MATLPGVELVANNVHSVPLPRPGFPTTPTTDPQFSGPYESKRKKIQRPRLDRPQASYSAASIAAMYGYPQVATSKEWVAFISLGGGVAATDKQNYSSQYGFPDPPMRIVSVDGATNDYTGDPNSADGENALDYQNIIGATGGKVGILMYIAPNSGKGFANAVAQVAKDNVACALSISWGSTEANNTAADRASMDAALAACEAANIPVFCASGDDGSSDGSPGTNDDYPASSPYAIGCGGTTLGNAGERAWTSGGGGPSHVYPKPEWQTTAPGTARGVPDVSANADPNTGYPIVLKGVWATFGGTSAVGPMWAAAVALIVTITGKRLANLVQTIYQSNKLTDITAGNNGAWQAGVGYDYCTGEGTPNKGFFDYLTATPAPPVPPTPVPPPNPIPVPPAPPPTPTPTPPPPPAPPPTHPGRPTYLAVLDAALNILMKWHI